MLFDFAAYLLKLDPSQFYTISELSGGLINVTVRALKTNTDNADSGAFPKHKSLILKYAPPFVAAVGESAPFSQFRQAWLPSV
jgi:hypothetical protein